MDSSAADTGSKYYPKEMGYKEGVEGCEGGVPVQRFPFLTSRSFQFDLHPHGISRWFLEGRSRGILQCAICRDLQQRRLLFWKVGRGQGKDDVNVFNLGRLGFYICKRSALSDATT